MTALRRPHPQRHRQRRDLRRGRAVARADLARHADPQLRPGRDADGHDVHRLDGDRPRRARTGSASSSRWSSGLRARRGRRARGDPPVEGAPPLNAVIVTLGLLVLLQAVAGMIWGGNPRSFPPAFSIKGFEIGGHTVLVLARPTCSPCSSSAVADGRRWSLLFRRTDLGLRMRAAAFAPEVSRLLGVRVGPHVHARAGRSRRWPARWPACSSRPRCSSRPTTSTRCSSSASPRRCSAGWRARRARWSAACCSAWR